MTFAQTPAAPVRRSRGRPKITPDQRAERAAERAAAVRQTVAEFARLPDDAWLRVCIVAALFDVSETTIWSWAAGGKIARPRKLGNTVGWAVGDIRRALRETSEKAAA